MTARDELEQLSTTVQDRFLAEKHVLSFEEYLDEFLSQPARHSRDAARYLRDCFDYFGRYAVERPTGRVQRYRLFDQAFVDTDGEATERFRLVGHELLQHAFYVALGNFSREGRANRLLLLHGPNGSAKSTFAACIMRALETYSGTPEGSIYRFSWVFPAGHEEKIIGFGARGRRPLAHESFAHIDPARVAAKLTSPLPEHPLLLLPNGERRALLRRAYEEHGVTEEAPAMIWSGQLAHKNAEVRDALLRAYGGDMGRVLAHIQVERFIISRRYRRGSVTIGPQMTVDAGERQITADRTLGQLPAALSALSLFEPHGELVDGSAGLIEYSDLLKRPLDAWKYLLLAIESGEVPLNFSILPVNSVLLGSTNESHLTAFRQHPEYDSFRARLTLMRVGYLLDYRGEEAIYTAQILPQLKTAVAPHTTFVAALWAVLTRLRRSDPSHYEDPQLGKLAATLTPMEKALLYADGKLPRRLSADETKLLRANISEVATEFAHVVPYEGMFGASPREVRTVILDSASRAAEVGCLSPLLILERIETLCEGGDYEFLKISPDGGFHDPMSFVAQVKEAWLDLVDDEIRSATGLIDTSQVEDLFSRYVAQISLWVKGERVRDTLTGELQDPDQTLFARIEDALEVDNPEDFRRNLINVAAAHAIDHPGEPMRAVQVFPDYVHRVKEAYFADHRAQIAAQARWLLLLLDEGSDSLQRQELNAAQDLRKRLAEDYGYCDPCARAVVAVLLRERYAEA